MDSQRENAQNFVLIVVDAVCLVVSYLIACGLIVVLKGNPLHFTFQTIIDSLWMIFITYFCVFIFFNMNEYLMKRDNYEEFVYIIKVNFIMAAVMIMVFFSAKRTGFISRGIVFHTVWCNIVLMYVGHIWAKKYLRYKNSKRYSKQYIYLVTTSDRVERIVSKMKKHRDFSSYSVRIAILDKNMIGQECQGVKIVANRNNLLEYACVEILDEAYINVAYDMESELDTYIEEFSAMGITVSISLDILENKNSFEKMINKIGGLPVVSFAPNCYNYNKLVMKRIIDIVGAIVGLVITGLISLILVPAIKLDSPGPALFKQKRVGRNGRYFYIYKFRSMYRDAEERKAALMAQNEMKGAMFKMTDDPRITRVGKFIRATSLDELPQFWNVFKGDMSLVGTRPPTVDEFKEYKPHHKRRLSMKPGLTGMWQVSGRSNIEDFEEVVRLDCEYIDNWSLQLDAMILLKTVAVVFKKVGSK